MLQLGFKYCPIECTVDIIGRKWAIPIIRDLFKGKTRFTQFLEENPKLSSKVLSKRLKELQQNGIVNKNIVQTTPLLIEYKLTEKGKSLGGILFHLASFSLKYQQNEVYQGMTGNTEKDMETLKKVFKIPL
jgi:DNA-binding HxlR family transcriptional regulator